MKKTSKAIRKDYSKFYYTNREYYGLTYRDGKLFIDIKRFINTVTSVDIPDKAKYRKTVYYSPLKKKRSDYWYNYFFDTVQSLKKTWNNEIKKVITKIQTPKEVEDNVRIGSLMDGVLDYEEVMIHSRMSAMFRVPEYYKAIKMVHGQFLMYIKTVIDSCILTIMRENGYHSETFSRKEFYSFFDGLIHNKSIKIDQIESHKAFLKLSLMNNFIKHSTLDTYKKLVKEFPETVVNTDEKYENGNFALWWIVLSDEIIEELIDSLIPYFMDICKYAFNENTDDALWDYEDWFIAAVDDEIDSTSNPLGLPDYI